jgi:hypothetical protein
MFDPAEMAVRHARILAKISELELTLACAMHERSLGALATRARVASLKPTSACAAGRPA